MIRATVSFRIAPGKNLEAMEYLTSVSKHIKTLTGPDYRILTRLVGPMGHVILSGGFETIAEWDKSRAKTNADAAFQKMAADSGSRGLFIPGSIESAVWQEH